MNSMDPHAERPYPEDDERLSAYLDGELSPPEHAQLEARLVVDPTLRRTVDELRAVRRAFAAFPEYKPGPDFAAAVLRLVDEGTPPPAIPHDDATTARTAPQALAQPAKVPRGGTTGVTVYRRAVALWASLAAAAALLLMLFTHPDQPAPQDEIAVRTPAAPPPVPQSSPAAAPATSPNAPAPNNAAPATATNMPAPRQRTAGYVEPEAKSATADSFKPESVDQRVRSEDARMNRRAHGTEYFKEPDALGAAGGLSAPGGKPQAAVADSATKDQVAGAAPGARMLKASPKGGASAKPSVVQTPAAGMALRDAEPDQAASKSDLDRKVLNGDKVHDDALKLRKRDDRVALNDAPTREKSLADASRSSAAATPPSEMTLGLLTAQPQAAETLFVRIERTPTARAAALFERILDNRSIAIVDVERNATPAAEASPRDLAALQSAQQGPVEPESDQAPRSFSGKSQGNFNAERESRKPQAAAVSPRSDQQPAEEQVEVVVLETNRERLEQILADLRGAQALTTTLSDAPWNDADAATNGAYATTKSLGDFGANIVEELQRNDIRAALKSDGAKLAQDRQGAQDLKNEQGEAQKKISSAAASAPHALPESEGRSVAAAESAVEKKLAPADAPKPLNASKAGDVAAPTASALNGAGASPAAPSLPSVSEPIIALRNQAAPEPQAPKLAANVSPSPAIPPERIPAERAAESSAMATAQEGGGIAEAPLQASKAKAAPPHDTALRYHIAADARPTPGSFGAAAPFRADPVNGARGVMRSDAERNETLTPRLGKDAPMAEPLERAKKNVIDTTPEADAKSAERAAADGMKRARSADLEGTPPPPIVTGTASSASKNEPSKNQTAKNESATDGPMVENRPATDGLPAGKQTGPVAARSIRVVFVIRTSAPVESPPLQKPTTTTPVKPSPAQPAADDKQ